MAKKKVKFNRNEIWIEAIDDIQWVFSLMDEKCYERMSTYIGDDKWYEIKHNTQKLKEYIKNLTPNRECCYEKRGHYRLPVTATEQEDLFAEEKFVFVQEDNLMFWLESKELRDLNYDYPEENLKQVEYVPLSICGVDGNEFVDDQRVVYFTKATVKVITGEDAEILQGHLKGDGSEILYS